MTDLGKSLHGLMVAFAMAGAIAGSAILFSYASSDGSVPAPADTTASEAPEPVIVEKVVEKPVYFNRTAEVEKEVEKHVYIYVDKTEDDSDAPEDKQKDDDLLVARARHDFKTRYGSAT